MICIQDRLANEYHDLHARQPMETVDKCKPIHHEITSRLNKHLREKGLCTDILYTGSAYEQTQIGPDVEFDLMLVRPEPNVKPEPHSAFPGFANLLDQGGSRIDPKSTMHNFKGEVQKFINSANKDSSLHANLKNCDMLLRDHGGPAIQMDVNGIFKSGEKFSYSVDLVPTHKVGDVHFVAKPLKDSGDKESGMLWRISGSPKEKAMLLKADKGNLCHREVIRICKCIRNRESNLRPIASIMIKSQLLWEMERNPDPASWTRGLLGRRTKDTLNRLADSLQQGELKKFSVPEMNLLQDMTRSTGINMANQIRRLVNHPHKLYPTGTATGHFDVNVAAREFHDTYAGRPKEALHFCKPIHERICREVIPALRQKGLCKRIEYIGSAYDRTQIGPNVDIDLYAVQKLAPGHSVEPDKRHPGLAHLVDGSSGKHLDPSTSLDRFKGEFQKIFNDLKLPFNVVLRDKAPGIQMAVYEGKRSLYAADIILAYETGKRLYVASPSKEDALPGSKAADSKTWRLVNPLADKAHLKGADSGNGARKQALRACKAIRDRETNLKPLTSHILKTALFTEMANHPEQAHWSKANLGNRIVDTLAAVKTGLDQGHMENPFNPGVNLLADMSAQTNYDISHRLGHLLGNQQQLF